MMISAFARESGLSVDTVRFYVRRELLHPEVGQKGGSRPYQMFSAADLETARTIQIGQALGLSLEEINSLLKMKALDDNSKLLAFLADQRGRLARKASELQRLISFRNVSTTLIQPGLEFRLGWSGRLCGIELSEAAGFLV